MKTMLRPLTNTSCAENVVHCYTRLNLMKQAAVLAGMHAGHRNQSYTVKLLLIFLVILQKPQNGKEHIHQYDHVPEVFTSQNSSFLL